MDHTEYSVLSVLAMMPSHKELSMDLKDTTIRHFEKGNSYSNISTAFGAPCSTVQLVVAFGPRDKCKCALEGTAMKVTRPCSHKGQSHGEGQPHSDTGDHQGGFGSNGHLCLKVHSDMSTEQDWGAHHPRKVLLKSRRHLAAWLKFTWAHIDDSHAQWDRVL